MSVVNILFHTGSDDIGIFHKQASIFFAHFGSHFIGYVDQLPEIGIVVGMSRNMTECIRVFFACPAVHFLH